MQAELAAEFDVVTETYAEASEVLGYDLWALVQSGPTERLAETVVTQPAMMTAGVAAWRVWQAAGGGGPSHMAGHSLGEYTALVCAGAVSFADALSVVIRRAALMQNAVPAGNGMMAAVLGLDDETIIAVCKNASDEMVAEPVNFNAPGQVVIAGDKIAVERAMELAKKHGAMRTIALPVSVPAHTSLMREAGEALAEELARAQFSTPEIRVLAASDALPYSDAGDIRRRLSCQVYRPVRWVATVNAMLDAGVGIVIEAGPGKVLARLMRRIDKAVPVAAVDSKGGLAKALTLYPMTGPD
jgi:[acyl-carrier-protein] S-malonyltransferase